MNAAFDLFAPAATVPEPAAGGYVVCGFAGLTLAIPHADVAAIEHAAELGAPLPGEAAVGWFNSAQGPWPAFALDERMQLLNHAPPRSFLAFLHAQPAPLGVLCETVRIARSHAELPVEPLPAIMACGERRFRGVARLDASHLALVLFEGALAAHIAALRLSEAPDG